ncbi:phospholipid phosphatase 1-like isoform X2 [Plodia interpunctella]|uniref:phospholipid phosphatase 1-like isoform X2 n=1 Tax=Plodia interpunctella TaxID=58824 RepID=UPI0023680595|nr:phospholipid phosphatase 1-like isoform X2 [Plodia interpunctella]
MDKIKQLWSKTNRWHRLVHYLPSNQLGFECNDPALSHPFTGDTISWKWLLGVVLFLPLVVMLIVERKYNADVKTDQSKQQAVFWYKEYLYGTLLNLTIVHILKISVGSPRPHFFDTCSPKEAETCQGSEFVSSYTCTKAHWVSQSDKSFPSGHTSLAIHAGLFIAYYLQRRGRRRWAQLLSAGGAALCGGSRLRDRRHHWWDVLAGALVAAPILIYTIHTLCDNFQCPKRCDIENKSDTKPNDNVNLVNNGDT